MVFLLIFFALENILVLLAKPNSGELCSPATALTLSGGFSRACADLMNLGAPTLDFRPGVKRGIDRTLPSVPEVSGDAMDVQVIYLTLGLCLVPVPLGFFR